MSADRSQPSNCVVADSGTMFDKSAQHGEVDELALDTADTQFTEIGVGGGDVSKSADGGGDVAENEGGDIPENAGGGDVPDSGGGGSDAPDGGGGGSDVPDSGGGGSDALEINGVDATVAAANGIAEETQLDQQQDHKLDNLPVPSQDQVEPIAASLENEFEAEEEAVDEEDTEVTAIEEGDENPEESAGSSLPAALCHLPISRIKRIMKFDPEVGLVNQEASLLVAKATELFILAFSRQVARYTLQCKRKTLQKKDVAEVVERVADFEFLEGVFETGY